MCLFVCVCVWCVSVTLSPAYVLFHPVARVMDVVVNRLAVTPFPLDSFPVPSTVAVVQPVSDLGCAHTDRDTQ